VRIAENRLASIENPILMTNLKHNTDRKNNSFEKAIELNHRREYSKLTHVIRNEKKE
jgi:hypothetical protein